MHHATATGANQAVRFDDFFNTRQCGRQIADGASGCGPGRPVARFGGTRFLLCLHFRKRDRQIIERQLCSSSDSFSDRFPCKAWFSSAIRCSCRRVMSFSAATSSINARTAARCAAGMAERSRAGAVCIRRSYHQTSAKTRKSKYLIHSAAAGVLASRALTLRQSSPEKSASNCAWFNVINPSLTVGQVKLVSSSRL